MGKKKASGAKLSAKAEKKAKAIQKIERKEKKKSKGKGKDGADNGEDLESILEQMRQEWEAAHSVTEELVEGPPSRRANATLTVCPTGNHLWFIGGELFSEDGKAYFYNDLFRYSPEKDEWRKFISPTCPGPRSAHAVAVTAAGGGKLFLFGGEFSSQNQTTFYHYRDFWCFDIATHSWDRIDTKLRPTARSGHRLAVWKHYIVLFGGFHDPGITTRYLNDLWVFDTQEYKWRLIEFKPNESRPSPRSGFSFLSTTEGIVLHGGYCKEYAKGKRPIGIMLEDTWVLKMSIPDPSSGTGAPAEPSSSSSKKKLAAQALSVKWERQKRSSTAYAPALRSGCTMTAWQAKEMGVMFGGVTDEDTSEETLESVFWNDLNAYQWNGKGRWFSLTLRKPKKKPGAGGGRKKQTSAIAERGDRSDDEDEEYAKTSIKATPKAPSTVTTKRLIGDDTDPDDPILTTPLPRYNAMLAVLKNTLYIYGGIFERGSREYTLDDFHSIHLDKMDRFVCLKESDIVIEEGDDESDEEDKDGDDNDTDTETDSGTDEGDSDDEGTIVGSVTTKDEEDLYERLHQLNFTDDLDSITVIEEDDDGEGEYELTTTTEPSAAQANAFMGVSKNSTRSPEDILSTPLPGETLAMFYSRSREYWSQKALGIGPALTDARGKQLRAAGFSLAEERYKEYKPILEEVEKMLSEAGLDEEEIRKSAAGGMDAGSGKSRNRR
ncbi:galactose oxidase [Lentinula aciculospora]|uniref:Galactose oxidase n=1 Tax=Lentinula aciculospora TaxID=153920 RepID=A0A9W8ZTD5_9AGAR|nr:galactose oxidase [Lentinula aciculospora]